MLNIIQIILNYIWFLIKLILFSSAISVPFVIIIGLSESIFRKINKKRKNFLISLFILIYVILYIILLLVYFVPIIINGFGFSFWHSILFIIIQIIRLAIVNILLSAIILIFGFICSAIYEKINKNHKKKKLKEINLLKLWISLIITTIIALLFILIFPSLIAILLYLIYSM